MNVGLDKGTVHNIVLKEKWKSATDKGDSFGALLTDLSNAFVCLQYELLLAMLQAHGFRMAALKLIVI